MLCMLHNAFTFTYWYSHFIYFQIMWLVDVFRAKIVDTSEQYLTIEVTFIPSVNFIPCA